MDLVLPSGKIIRANKGIIGINPKLDIYEGYDGTIDIKEAWGNQRLSKEDRQILAKHAIELWEKYASLE